MGGCFGNSPEDRYFENQLFAYLDACDADDDDDDVPELPDPPDPTDDRPVPSLRDVNKKLLKSSGKLRGKRPGTPRK